MKPKNHRFLPSAGLFALFALMLGSLHAAADKPNILLLFADDQRQG
jgi:hypothetical protein